VAQRRKAVTASLKLRVEVDGVHLVLDLTRNGAESRYRLRGALDSSGEASVCEVMPGVFSVLLGYRSFTVALCPSAGRLEAVSAGVRRFIHVSDLRDRSRTEAKPNPAEPAEIRAQMPGKVIRVLITSGANVQAGQGLIVVEAMKMQNEMKAPKTGVVSRIDAREGSTVAAGELLLVIE